MKSRNEIDFIRLLKQCQKLADPKCWRLERYVESLSEYLDKLRNQNVNQLSRDTLEEYGRKIQFLRGIIETEKLPSAEKRLLAAELLAPDQDTKVTHLITTNKYHEQVRHKLLLSNRRRGGGGKEVKETNDGKDVDLNEDLMHNLQELTKNIRENMHTAQVIIKKDNETLSRVATGADNIRFNLEKNTNKLFKFVGKGQFGIWLALALVTFTFLMMIFFIRFFPKH